MKEVLFLLALIVISGCVGQPTTTTTSTTTIASLTMEYCESLESGREIDLCKKDLAIQNNDESICEELIVNDAKSYCEAYFAKDPSLCEGIKDATLKEDCITDAS